MKCHALLASAFLVGTVDAQAQQAQPRQGSEAMHWGLGAVAGGGPLVDGELGPWLGVHAVLAFPRQSTWWWRFEAG